MAARSAGKNPLVTGGNGGVRAAVDARAPYRPPGRRHGRRMTAYWPLAVAEIAVAIVVALTLPDLETHFHWADGLDYDASTAQTTLAAIAGGMITLTGFVLTAVTLMVQTVQNQSSRLLQGVNRTDKTPLLFGTFGATFTYALLVLSVVHGDDVPTSPVRRPSATRSSAIRSRTARRPGPSGTPGSRVSSSRSTSLPRCAWLPGQARRSGSYPRSAISSSPVRRLPTDMRPLRGPVRSTGWSGSDRPARSSRILPTESGCWWTSPSALSRRPSATRRAPFRRWIRSMTSCIASPLARSATACCMTRRAGSSSATRPLPGTHSSPWR